jgi:hypothetical protein
MNLHFSYCCFSLHIANTNSELVFVKPSLMLVLIFLTALNCNNISLLSTNICQIPLEIIARQEILTVRNNNPRHTIHIMKMQPNTIQKKQQRAHRQIKLLTKLTRQMLTKQPKSGFTKTGINVRLSFRVAKPVDGAWTMNSGKLSSFTSRSWEWPWQIQGEPCYHAGNYSQSRQENWNFISKNKKHLYWDNNFRYSIKQHVQIWSIWS